MIITTVGKKGGIGKTTTAVHCAGVLHEQGEKILFVDGDPNRSATQWKRRGEPKNGIPFEIIGLNQVAKYAQKYQHLIIDTQAGEDEEAIQELADGCDLLILPVLPNSMSLDPLIQLVKMLNQIKAHHYRILFNRVPTKGEPEKEVRQLLLDLGIKESNLLKTCIHETNKFDKASDEGVLISNIQRRDMYSKRGWSEYCEVVGEIVNG